MATVQHDYDTRVAAIHKVRINVKSLAAEARIIRRESERCGPAYRNELTNHRRGRVREEARYAQLGLAFLRGRPYRVVEEKCFVVPEPKRVIEKLKRYIQVNEKDVIDWLK